MALANTDIKALDDLPDPEELVSGDENIAYAQARRFLQPDGALEDIGDDGEFASMDVRDALGRRMDETDRADFEATANLVATADEERINSAEVVVSLGGNVMTIEETHETATGEYRMVLRVDDVSATLLKDG
jgi:hypothetical protein